MKRLFTMMLLTASAGAVLAQPIQRAIIKRDYSDFPPLLAIPQAFSYDGKPTMHIGGSGRNDITIYDSDFKVQSTITPIASSAIEYRIVEEREDLPTVTVDGIYSDPELTDCTIDEARDWMDQNWVSSRIEEERSDGTYFFNKYDYEEVLGVKYARIYMRYENNTLYRVRCDYYVQHSYTGDWTTERYDNGISRRDVTRIRLHDWRTTYSEGKEFLLSQTLFNADATIEYVVPLEELVDFVSYTADRDYDGDIDLKETTYIAIMVGFSIVAENGNVLQDVRFDSSFEITSSQVFNVYLIDDKCYLVIEGKVTEADEKYWCSLVYEIDRSASQNSIRQLAQHVGAKVCPRVVSPSETITVELGENSGAREIWVVNAAGQTVKRIPVEGHRERVSFSAQGLSRGVNIVNVAGGASTDSSKIIVK